MAGVTVPVIPFAHQYLVTEPIEGVTPDLPQLRDPDNLVYFRPEVARPGDGRLRAEPGGLVARRHPARLQRQAAAARLAAVRGDQPRRQRRVPAMADAGVRQVINGPEGFTPDNEFILGESEVRGFFVAAGFWAHGIAGAGGMGGQLAHWIVDGEPELGPVEDGHPPLRLAVPLACLHPGPGDRELRDLLRHPLPERGAAVRPAAARRRPTYDAARGAGVRVRREGRLGAAELVRVERRGRRRVAPAAGLGGEALVAGDRRRGAGHPAARPRSSTRRASPRSRSAGRARSPSCSGCARTTWIGRWAGSPTPRCSTGAAGSSATSP